jgi:hypothetical protein
MVLLARVFGGLWILASILNCWKVLIAVANNPNPSERVGWVIGGLVLVPAIFYCAYQVVAISSRIATSLKILMAISFLPVLMHGIIPLELGTWFFLDVVPSMLLIRTFSA